MKFKPTFRTLDSSDLEYPLGIRYMKKSPLILVKADGVSTYASNQGDKDKIVESFNEEEDLLLFAWAGQWSTDVFQLSKADLDKHYEAND